MQIDALCLVLGARPGAHDQYSHLADIRIQLRDPSNGPAHRQIRSCNLRRVQEDSEWAEESALFVS
jgi:hypothetical protein